MPEMTVAARLRSALPYLVAGVAAEHYLQGIVIEAVRTRPGDVDFGVYFRAAQAFAAHQPIYPSSLPCCFSVRAMDGYTYPPVLAVALRPLTLLGVGVAGRLFLVLSQACLVLALLVMHRTVRGMVDRRVEVWLLAAILAFQPIHAGNYGLQVSNALLLLYALAAHSFVRGRRGWLAGAALGLGAAVKVAPPHMLPALLTERSPRTARAVGGFALGLGVPLLLVWAVVPETPRYFTDVLPSFAGGVASPFNRSLPGVVLWTTTATGHQPPAVYSTLFHLLEIGGLAATWLWCRRTAATPEGRAAVFAAFLALLPVTQAVTWDHHIANDALAFVLIAPSLAAWSRSWWAAVAGMALMCVNEQPMVPWMQGGGLDPPHGIGVVVFVSAISVNLVGMALLYAAALQVASRHRAPLARPEPRRARRVAAPAPA
jgi:hypothetical protein